MRRATTWLVGSAVLFTTGCQQFLVTESKVVPPDSVSPSQIKPYKPIDEHRQPKPDTLAARGQMLFDQGAAQKDPTARQNYYDQAKQAYLQALAQDSKHVPSQLGLARLHEKQGNVPLAFQQFDQLLQQHPLEASLYYEYGRCLARNRHWQQAVACFERAASLDTQNSTYQRDYGFALAMSERFEDSAAVFRRSMTEAQAFYRVAQAAKHLKRDEVCRSYLERALQSDPQLQEAQRMLAELSPGNLPLIRTVTDANATVPAVQP